MGSTHYLHTNGKIFGGGLANFLCGGVPPKTGLQEALSLLPKLKKKLCDEWLKPGIISDTLAWHNCSILISAHV